MSFVTGTRLPFRLPSWRTQAQVLVSDLGSPASKGGRILLSLWLYLHANSELLFSVIRIHHGEDMVTTLNRQMRKQLPADVQLK